MEIDKLKSEKEEAAAKIILEMEHRIMNVIIAGIGENLSGSVGDRMKADRDAVKGLFHELKIDSARIVSHARIGRSIGNHSKPRLIRLTLDDIGTKVSLLKKCEIFETNLIQTRVCE